MLESCKVWISERRAQWFIRWAMEMAAAPTVHMKTFEEGLGRIIFVAGPIIRGFHLGVSGTLYREESSLRLQRFLGTIWRRGGSLFFKASSPSKRATSRTRFCRERLTTRRTVNLPQSQFQSQDAGGSHLSWRSCRHEPCLLTWHVRGQLQGLMCFHVDDVMTAVRKKILSSNV